MSKENPWNLKLLLSQRKRDETFFSKLISFKDTKCICHVNSASILEPFEIWDLNPQNAILSIPEFRVLLNYAVFTA